MPVKTDEYKEKLERYDSVEDLRYLYSVKILEILKEIIKCKNSNIPFKPSRWFKRRYSQSPERREQRVGRQFFYAAKEWLEHRGYLKRGYKITEKGHGAFLLLETFLEPPARESVDLTILWETKSKAECSIEAENMNAFDKLDILTHPDILDKSAELLYNLLFQGPRNFDFSIKVSGGSQNPKILGLFHIMRIVQGRIIDGSLSKVPLKNRKYLESSREWVAEGYRKVWTDLAEDALSKRKKKQPINIRDYHGFIRPGIIKLIKEDTDVKKWIDAKLDQDPNFFMPHIFWVHLGFKQRHSLEEIDATPVTYISLISWSGFEKVIIDLRHALDITKDHDDEPQRILHFCESLSPFILQLMTGRKGKLKDLYEAWRILRRKYENTLPVLSRILDAALEKYLINNRIPSVNLLEVLSDLKEKKRNISETIVMIREGKYDISVSSEKNPKTHLVEVFGSLLDPKERKSLLKHGIFREVGKVKRVGWKLSFDRFSNSRQEAVLNFVQTQDHNDVYYTTVFEVDDNVYEHLLTREMGSEKAKWKRKEPISDRSFRPKKLDSKFGEVEIFVIPEKGRSLAATTVYSKYVQIVKCGIEKSYKGKMEEVNFRALYRAVKESNAQLRSALR